MELYEGAYQIQSEFGGRNLFQYLLAGERSVLIDSGIASTPEGTILPFLDRLDHDPGRLSLLITTHPDLDHQGGNSAIRRAAPHALLACGEEDRAMVSDPRQLYTQRYNYLRGDHGLGFDDEPIAEAGAYCRVDIGFRGGERIGLADGWDLEVLHVPGHSKGHLTLYDRKNKSAFVSDALHGRGCPKIDGSVAIPVTYYYIEAYLSTLMLFDQLRVEHLYSGHWPNMHGEEVSDFLADSKRTVARLDHKLMQALSAAPRGLTLKQLIAEAGEEFPEWPKETLDLSMFAVNGHMERLVDTGRLLRLNDAGSPCRWVTA